MESVHIDQRNLDFTRLLRYYRTKRWPAVSDVLAMLPRVDCFANIGHSASRSLGYSRRVDSIRPDFSDPSAVLINVSVRTKDEDSVWIFTKYDARNQLIEKKQTLRHMAFSAFPQKKNYQIWKFKSYTIDHNRAYGLLIKN